MVVMVSVTPFAEQDYINIWTPEGALHSQTFDQTVWVERFDSNSLTVYEVFFFKFESNGLIVYEVFMTFESNYLIVNEVFLTFESNDLIVDVWVKRFDSDSLM